MDMQILILVTLHTNVWSGGHIILIPGHSAGKAHVHAHTQTVSSDVTLAPAMAPGITCT